MTLAMPERECLKKILIIAEAGVNHNGSPDMALDMARAASDAGADMIKFQTFNAELEISRHAPKAGYQLKNTGNGESQLEMVKRYELSRGDHEKIFLACQKLGIEFFSTPFDLPSVDLLTGLCGVGVKTVKIPSGEITNWPLVHRIGRSGKPTIMSTGMSTIDEIENALGVYLLGAIKSDAVPCKAEIQEVLASPQGSEYLVDNMTLMHCTTQYPAPFEDVNLRAMDALRGRFNLPVGYSDHTTGGTVSIAAAARGAVAIEKHFTLDRNLPGPDHKASIEPDELKNLVEAIRTVELAMGVCEKSVAPSELPNRTIARKSLVAACRIRAGERFTPGNIGIKRPAGGVEPSEYWSYLGRAASRGYDPDEMLD
jgi:N-acetylneuraminate synthase